MSDAALLQRSARRRRGSFEALPRGAAAGFAPGAVLGATGPVWFFVVDGGHSSEPFTAAYFAQFAAFLLFAAVVGACFGGLVGFVGGLGAVLVPERGARRNLAVMLAALMTGGLCFALLLSWLAYPIILLLPAGFYLVMTAVIAYRRAPILDGRPRRESTVV